MTDDYECTAVILTAVEIETRGVKHLFKEWHKVHVRGDHQEYYETYFKRGEEEYKIICCQQGVMGMTAATMLAAKATAAFHPKYLIMSGIAAGIGKEASQLYGDVIVGGISRMETGARCFLRHHLRYGLKLRERDIYEFEPVDGGSILHAALQRFDAMLQSEGLSWHDFSREDARRLSALALQQEAGVYRNLLLYKSARDEGRLGRYAKRLLRTVDTLQYQIRKGDFLPYASELSFGGQEGGLPAIRFDLSRGRRLLLVGRIDRVDQCAGEGRRYLRIMDYKTGRNDLDEDLIRRGLQLQLITYMEALMKAGPAVFPQGQQEVFVPSAMLYYRMNDPFIRKNASDVHVRRTLAEEENTAVPGEAAVDRAAFGDGRDTLVSSIGSDIDTETDSDSDKENSVPTN